MKDLKVVELSRADSEQSLGAQRLSQGCSMFLFRVNWAESTLSV